MVLDSRLRHTCLRVTALAAVILLVSCGLLSAQTTSASVSGTVKDAQGGVLPGATVTLTSETKGTVQTVTTDTLGNFLFAYVAPDRYTIKAALENFQSAQRAGITVSANDRIAIGAFTLNIGAMSETVTVTGATQDIQMKSGERAFTLESTAIQNLAVNGRSFFGLVGLIPGVAYGNTDPATQVSNFNVNGQRSNSNNFTMDGVANIDTGDNGGNMAQTNIDAIAEFKVLTSSYQAEYGRAVGGQVQVVTKSGSRDFRGSAYWYARRSKWNANSWWNNRSNTPMSVSSRNDEGFTVGGPIFIPGLFNTERNKLFFFFSQEFQRRADPVGESRVTVPTALERQGDFSQTVDNNGNPYPYIRNLSVAGACNASDQTACWKYQGVLGRIDPAALYGPGMAILKNYPAPNTTGQKGYNYRSQTVGTNPLNETMIRGDYQVSPNWRVTGRYMFHTNKGTLPYGIGGWSLGGNLDNMAVTSDVPGRNLLGSMTGIINNTTSLEVSFGQGHNSLDHYSTASNLTRAGSGISLPLLYPNAVQMDMLPAFGWGGSRIASAPQARTDQAPFTNFNTTYDIVANLTKVKGAHNMKMGIYFQRSLKDQSAFAPFNGNYNFGQDSNNPLDTGMAFSNAALGVYNTFTQANAFLKPKWRYSNFEWYLQDNWKVDKLSLDYGVRFYFITPQWDASGMASNFLPDKYDPSKAVRLYQPCMVGGTKMGCDPKGVAPNVNGAYIGRLVNNPATGTPYGDRFNGAFQAGNGISTTNTDGNKFKVSPRVGFAYDVTGKQNLIARGAFGIFYDRPEGNQVFNTITNPPGSQQTQLSWGYVKDITPGGTTGVYYAPLGLQPNVYDWKIPTVYQWNVGMQMRLPAEFTLDVAYVGSKSTNLLDRRNLNAIPYGAAYLDQYKDPTKSASATPGAQALATDFLRPYQGYADITYWEFQAFSDYKALQTTISRRFTKGLMFSFNYTKSSAKGTQGSDWDYARIDTQNERLANYGPMSFDHPNSFMANFVYQVPNAAKGGALQYLINDWQISGNWRWLSGTPASAGFNISGIGNVNLTGSYTEGARIVLTGVDPGSGYNNKDPYNQFNVAAFAPPTTGSKGLESPRVVFYNPPINNVDLSLSKQFPFGGKRRFEIRLDAFNALNHTQYSGVNRTLNFSGLGSTTVTNLPYDANGNLVRNNGVGTINGVRSPRQLQVMMRFTF